MDETHKAKIEIDASAAATGGAIAANAFTIIAAAAAQAAAALNGISKGGAAGGGSAPMPQIGKQANAMASALKQAAIAFGLFKLTQFTKDAILTAARFEELGIVIGEVGRRQGYTKGELLATAETLRDYGIAAAESRQSVLKFLQANLDLAHATTLARVAQDAAVVAGLNSSQTLSRITHGIVAGQTEVLRTVGITVNFNREYKKIADQGKKTVEQLTQQEKVQARANAVMKEGARMAGAYEASMTSASKQMRSWPRYIEDIKVAIGETFREELKAVVFAISDLLKGTAKWVEQNRTLILGLAEFTKYILPAIAGVWAMHKAVTAFKALTEAFGKSNWWILAITGAAALIGILQGMRRKWKEDAEEPMRKAAEQGGKLATALGKVNDKLLAQQNAATVTWYNNVQTALLQAQRLAAETEEKIVKASRSRAALGAMADNEAYFTSGLTGRQQDDAELKRAQARVAELERQLAGIRSTLVAGAEEAAARTVPKTTEDTLGLDAERVKTAKESIERSIKELGRAWAEFLDPRVSLKLRNDADEKIDAFTKTAKVAGTSAAEIKKFAESSRALADAEAAREIAEIANAILVAGQATRQAAADRERLTVAYRESAEVGDRVARQIEEETATRARAVELLDLELSKLGPAATLQSRLIATAVAMTRAVTEQAAARVLAATQTEAALNRELDLAQRMGVAIGEGSLAVAEVTKQEMIRAKWIELVNGKMDVFIALGRAKALVDQQQANAAKQLTMDYEKQTREMLKEVVAMREGEAAVKRLMRTREIARLREQQQIDEATAARIVDQRQQVEEIAKFEAQVRVSADEIRRNLVENTQRSFAEMLQGLMRDGIDSWRKFVNTLRDMFLSAIAQMASAKIMEKFIRLLRQPAGQMGGTASMAGMLGGGDIGRMGIGETPKPNNMQQGLLAQPGVQTFLKLLGGAAVGGMVGYQIGGLTTNKTMGVLGGAAGGAAAGAMVGGLPGAIAGGIVGGVAGWFGAAKKAKETAKLLEEARREFNRAMEGYVKNAFGTDSPVARAQREARAQRDAMRKQANEALPGRANETERNQRLQEIEHAYAAQILKISVDFQQDLQDAVDILKGRDWQVQMRQIQKQYEEYRRALIDANLDPALAEKWFIVAKDKLDREIAAFTKDFDLDLASRQASLAGRSDAAAAAEVERSRLREIQSLEDLYYASKISTEQFNAMTKVIEEETARALEAIQEAARQRREDLEFRKRLAAGETSGRELERIQLGIQHRRELAAATNDAERAILVHIHALEQQALAAQQAAESLATMRSLDVRSLRAQGKDAEADLLERQIGMWEEQEAFVERFGETSAETYRLIQVQFEEWKQWLQTQGKAPTGTAGGVASAQAKFTADVAAANAFFEKWKGGGAAVQAWAKAQQDVMLEQARAAYKAAIDAAFGPGGVPQGLKEVQDALTAGAGGGAAAASFGSVTVAQGDRMVSLLEQIAANTASLRGGGAPVAGAGAALDVRALDQTLGTNWQTQKRLAGNSRIEIA